MAIAMMHVLVAGQKQKFPRFCRVVDGVPLSPDRKGHWHKESMYALGVQDTDVMAAARGKGLKHQDQIEYAILERNGKISVIRKPEE